MTDDPEGALLDPEIPDQDNATATRSEKLGLAFYGALALVGILVFLIIFMNVAGIRASAGLLLTQHTWTLQSYAGPNGILVPAIPGSPVTARFTIDGHMSGSSGCNLYSSHYTTKDLAITIFPPDIAERYCENQIMMQQESAYVTVLTKAVEIRVNETNLNLYDKTGKPVLKFVATS